MKNTLIGINNRSEDAEWISNLEDRVVETIQAKQQKEKKSKKKKNESKRRDLWDNIKHTNISQYRVPEEKKEKGENLKK